MRIPRPLTILALLTLLLGGLLTVTPPRVRADSGTAGAACFQETGFCVQGRFLNYWQANGGLARNGFPLTNEQQELLEDGNTYTVQYFERVRLEYHPENAAPYDVLLGQFGRRVYQSRFAGQANPRVESLPNQTYFPETGHNVPPPLFTYWQANGGLVQFGYPLTEVFDEFIASNGRGAYYQVQYFERARFELHPETPPPYNVLLGQFGRDILAENALLAGDPGFMTLYLTNERVRDELGGPSDRAFQYPSAYQGFEHGAMIAYRQGSSLAGIYVLCGDQGAGQLLRPQVRNAPEYFYDPWDPSQPVGGGPGPRPGLYEPARGFGRVWRENQQVHDCLGYATESGETSFTGRLQPFHTNALIAATTPAGRFIYVLYAAGVERRYERYPDPSR